MPPTKKRGPARPMAGRPKTRATAPPTSPVIVGVGASAGGLEALTQLLKSLPDRPGAAFVVVQHLDPRHESILPALLARATAMPVREAKDGTRLHADHVHVIPPALDVEVEDGHLRLVPRPANRAPHMPLDLFLGTLAEAEGNRAIAVILSGTGTDGTAGCKAVKAAGGIAFAQDPATARYDGMPKSVIGAGCVDFVLPPQGIAHEIVRLARDPYLRKAAQAAVPSPPAEHPGALPRIFALLLKATGADFTCYKKTTLTRRIQRRMALHTIETLDEYARRLEGDRSEVQALHQDLLINVTSFFRDPDTFQALCQDVFPRILAGRSANAPLRVWVPGCATGEEAYSLAMCLLEVQADLGSNPPLQVFATDLSETAIDKARAGVYVENITSDVSPERLSRFFVKGDGRYQVSKSVRDLIVFARQDLARDPPFSRLDLVSCRNVLIYLEPSLQKRVLGTFHYALGPAGFLVLGKSETVGASLELFTLEDKEHKIYSKRATAGAAAPSPRAGAYEGKESGSGRPVPAPAVVMVEPRTDVEREAERLLLSRYAPASVLVDEAGLIRHFRGDTEPYLGHAQGAASLNLMKMARREIVPELHQLLQKARDTNAPQRKVGLVLRDRGRTRRVGLEVVPIKGPASGERSFLVLFEPRSAAGEKTAPVAVPKGEKAKDRRIAQLEGELLALRHYQHAVEEEQAASNEELQSANEEVLSSNEELQSINEEMETAKEELQSSNEELTTLNEELQNRNQELGRLNDDLDNFLASTTLPTLMLGANLVLRRFTPAAAKLLNLAPADLGRPLGHLRLGLEIPDLEPLILGVIATVRPQERELQDHDGCWWRLHVRPYRTRDDRIDGAVLVLVDIDALKRTQEVLEHARDFADSIVSTVREPLLLLDAELRVRRANGAFYRLFRVTPQGTEGTALYALGERQWDIPALRAQLGEVLARDQSFEDFVVDQEFPSLGRRTMVLNARRLRGGEDLILLAIEDRTDAARLELERAEILEHARQAAAAAEAANRLKDEFVATASHELRGPLNAMAGWVHLLAGGKLDAAGSAHALDVIRRSVHALTRLIEELLDVTRIMTGKLRLAMRMVDLRAVVEAALESVRPTALAKGVDVVWGADTGAETVRGDPDRLQQVVWNLLTNAVKFTPRGGRVEVWIGRVEGDVQVRVSDTGQGIAASFLPHVFERFRQADSSPSRSQPGLGLGLAIVRQLVEMHGGSVSAASAGEGQGSTFRVSLPVPTLTVPVTPAESAPDTPAPAWMPPDVDILRGVHVLVVDDDADARDVLTSVLEQCGATVSGVDSAAAALALFDRGAPDVLVSDIGMPERDGYELMREVRRRPSDRGGDVPALALTAYASADASQKAAAAGYQAYLTKPADPAELVGKVAALGVRKDRTP